MIPSPLLGLFQTRLADPDPDQNPKEAVAPWMKELADAETDARWDAFGAVVVGLFVVGIGQGFLPRACANLAIGIGIAVVLLLGLAVGAISRQVRQGGDQ